MSYSNFWSPGNEKPCLPGQPWAQEDTPKIRTPADILGEEAAKVQAEQQELRVLVNEKLPRKPGAKEEIWVGRFTSEVTAPVITEVKKAGWSAKVEYNKLIIEFPKGA